MTLKISTWNILTSLSSWPSKKIKSIRLKCLTHYETKKVLIEMVFRWVYVEGLEQYFMEILHAFKQMSACWKLDVNFIFDIWESLTLHCLFSFAWWKKAIALQCHWNSQNIISPHYCVTCFLCNIMQTAICTCIWFVLVTIYNDMENTLFWLYSHWFNQSINK